ncbi:hypothetical protein D3C71_1463950 [compost metagenome]
MPAFFFAAGPASRQQRPSAGRQTRVACAAWGHFKGELHGKAFDAVDDGAPVLRSGGAAHEFYARGRGTAHDPERDQQADRATRGVAAQSAVPARAAPPAIDAGGGALPVRGQGDPEPGGHVLALHPDLRQRDPGPDHRHPAHVRRALADPSPAALHGRASGHPGEGAQRDPAVRPDAGQDRHLFLFWPRHLARRPMPRAVRGRRGGRVRAWLSVRRQGGQPGGTGRTGADPVRFPPGGVA